MPGSTSSGIFLAVLTLAAGFFALNVQRLVAYMRLGAPENRFDHPFERLKNVIVIGMVEKGEVQHSEMPLIYSDRQYWKLTK